MHGHGDWRFRFAVPVGGQLTRDKRGTYLLYEL